ncbi:MAG: Xaa-Pro peptidase family protein [Candidatus Rifleibacteriota bacterium]
MNYSERIKKYQKLFKKDCQAVLVTDSTNIRYLCGFSGSCGFLLVTSKDTYFFTDFRYQEQSAKEIGNAAKIEIFASNSVATVFKRVKACKIKKLGVERSLSIGAYELYKKEFDGGTLVPVEDYVRQIRQIKDAYEIKCLKKAFSIADKAFANLMEIIKPGMTEIEVAAHLEFFMKKGGSDEPSFATIIASGPNSSCPHAHPTNRKLKQGEMVKIDFGAVYKGYHSDMTRTIFIGKSTAKFRQIYEIVAKAQSEAVKAIKPGKKCSDIDKVARDIISKAGFGENFGHGLGHSLGLDIHEMPSLAAKCVDEIKEGMLFTVEPGIYIPGWGGIRIEDVFLVEKDRLVKLTKTSNKLKELLLWPL